MDNYIALVRKSDFVDLYKYGHIHINKDFVRYFTCNVEELSSKKAIFEDLISFANFFESTFSYLFIHYENLTGRINDVNISDVRGIYPLDNEAKIELETSFDSRIEIKNPLWPKEVFNWQKEQSFQSCKLGIKNIWKIYNIEHSLDSVSVLITDLILKEMLDGVFLNKKLEGDISIWNYVLRYERHAFYPNNTIGFFMDMVNIIFNYRAKREVDFESIEQTNIMQFLSHCNRENPDLKFNEILSLLNSSNMVINFVNYVKSIEADVDLIKIITLFLIYKKRYRENFTCESKWIKFGKSNGFEFSVACYLLGAVFGYEHTYDCLYDTLPLFIFKKSYSFEDITKNDIEDGDGGIIFPCMMGKLKRDGSFCSRPKPMLVLDIVEYEEKLKEGWAIYKK